MLLSSGNHPGKDPEGDQRGGLRGEMVTLPLKCAFFLEQGILQNISLATEARKITDSDCSCRISPEEKCFLLSKYITTTHINLS